MKYVLASASPRRQELLSRIIEQFDVVISNFNEDSIKFQGDIEKYVKDLAEGKAKEVSENLREPAIIIAADTIVVINNEILGKPKDDKDAFNMLKKLSGNTHRVYSAIVILDSKSNNIEKACIYTEVKFSNLSDEEIFQYIDTKEPLDKAGAYGIQGFGGVFVESINGCYYNVVGLPLNLLNSIIKKVK